MRNLTRLAIGLMVVAAVAASMMPAEAACNAPRAITSATAQSQSYFYSPGNPFQPVSDSTDGCYSDPGTLSMCGGSITYYVNAFFWAFSAGNPAIGLGADNGSLKGGYNSNWLSTGFYYGGTLYPGYIGTGTGHWQYPGVDGCIDATGSSSGATGLPDSQECMVVVLNDLNGPDSYFLALSTNPNAGFDFEFNGNAGFPAQLNLVPTPKPVVDSSTLSAGTVTLGVSLPVGALTRNNGFDFHCHGAPGEILSGWKLYYRLWPGPGDTTVPPEPASADSRSLVPLGPFPPTPPWISAGPKVPIGQPTAIQVPCGTGNVALCATLTFGGPSNEVGAADWELKYCSQSSTTVTCDPTLADPGAKKKLGRRELGTAPPAREQKPPSRR
jgi:hypothetical protein